MSMLSRLIAIAFVALIASAPAPARALPQSRVVNLHSTPYWVLNRGQMYEPSVDGKFTMQQYWIKGTGYVGASSLFSLTRTTPETITFANGLLAYAASGVFAISDLGQAVWESRTNDALYSSDLTQSGTWTATNVSAALNAIGPDNVANSAATITATSAAGTILQSITLDSGADTYSVYVKCVTCTGAISAAEYSSGAPAFTALTSSNCAQVGTGIASNLSTSYWVRCSLEATVLNPVIGFRFANSGDSIAVFCNQLEPGAFASPCIPTMSASVTRNADIPQLIEAAATAALNAKSAYFKTNSSHIGSNSPVLLSFAGGSRLQYGSTSQVEIYNGTNYLDATIGSSGVISNPVKSAFGFDSSGMTIVANGGTKATSANAWANNTGSSYLANGGGANRALNGLVDRIALSPVKGAFDGLTAP